MAEEALVFIPMLVMLAIGLGYDSLTGVAMALVGPCAGFTGAFMNPFTLGVAQGIVGLPIFSGLEYRVVIYIITTITATAFIYFYARKVKKNPETSIMYAEDQKRAAWRSGRQAYLHPAAENRPDCHAADLRAADLRGQ